MTIQELRQKISLMEQHAKMDLSQFDMRTRPAQQGLQKQAEVQLPSLRAELAVEILRQSYLVAMVGVSLQDEVIQNLREMGQPVVELDYNELSSRIFNGIFSEQLKRQTPSFSMNAEAYSKLNKLVADLAIQLRIQAIDQIRPQGHLYESATTDPEEARKKISDVLQETYLGTLDQLYLNNKLQDVVSLEVDTALIVVKNVPDEQAAQKVKALAGNSIIAAEAASGVNGSVLVTSQDTAKDVIDQIGRIFKKEEAKATTTKKTNNKRS